MARSLTANRLRALSKKGEANVRREKAKADREQKKQQRKKELEDARLVIANAEERMKRVASARGAHEFSVCSLHSDGYDPRFETIKSPEFLGLFGRTVYQHFKSKGFTILFKYDSEPDRGDWYELIVRW